MDSSTPGFPVLHHLPELAQTHLLLFNHLVICCPLHFLPSIFPSIRVFSNESTLRIRGPKYWWFSFSNSLSNEYSWLISIRITFLSYIPYIFLACIPLFCFWLRSERFHWLYHQIIDMVVKHSHSLLQRVFSAKHIFNYQVLIFVLIAPFSQQQSVMTYVCAIFPVSLESFVNVC